MSKSDEMQSAARAAMARHPALNTRICELFGIRYPIIQTGMGWVSGPWLTKATSAAGGMGILAAATMTFPELEEAIDEVRDHTDNPFGVNLRADQNDVMDRVKLLIDKKVKVASFAQAPGKKVIQTLKDAGVVTMPTIGAKRHAEKVAEWGVDAVIAQGAEGGGHTGVIPTSLLLPEVADTVDIPILGAGGFCDGRGLIAALSYGASGIAMGTRFLLTEESRVERSIKQTYLKTKTNGTVVTKAIDGYPQRVIRTELINKMEAAGGLMKLMRAGFYGLQFQKVTGTPLFELLREGLAMKQKGDLTYSQLMMASNAPMLTKASMVDGRPDIGILPTGQVVGRIEELPTVEELVTRIMVEAGEVLDRLTGKQPNESQATDQASAPAEA